MADVYRIKVKTDKLEMEVEGPSKEFVETYVDKLMEQVQQQKGVAQTATSTKAQATKAKSKSKAGTTMDIVEERGEKVVIVTPRTTRKRKTSKSQVVSKTSDEASQIDPVQVAAAIRNSEYYPIVKEKVLQARNQLNKILLVSYYILKTYSRRPATVGTIESITEELGARLKSSNIATQIKKRLDLFEVVEIKRRRIVKGYIINKAGVKYVENNILKG